MIHNLSLPKEIQHSLGILSKKLGREEDDLVREAVIRYLEDLEDILDAEERLSNPPERYFTLKEVEQELGLDNQI